MMSIQIANPIYDSVFKYLLEDNRLAKLILSTILGEEVVELEFVPQEHSVPIKHQHRQFTVYRLDFAATVRNAAGEMRKVLIEIQKAKLSTDIMRFRRYLGEQYRSSINTYTQADGSAYPLPLLSIYFLGYPLEHSKAPVIHVKRESRDLTTNELLKEKEIFIESLTHDSYVIQIPCLRKNRQTNIEKLLYFFDQNNISADKHMLHINESEVDERYQLILRRLTRAIAETEIQAAMDVEDDILNELQTWERRTEQLQTQVEQAQAQAEQAQAQAEQAQAQANSERLEKERLLTLLKQSGIDPE